MPRPYSLLPRLDGREVLRRLRQAGNWTPVILLTQVGSPVERAVALDEGADDYLGKPFEPYELVARMRAVLRRSRAGNPSLAGARQLRCGALELDRQARRVTLAGRELPLTAKAVAILEYMMLHPDEVLARERLLDAVWGWDYPAATRAVATRIAELRRTLKDDAETPTYNSSAVTVTTASGCLRRYARFAATCCHRNISSAWRGFTNTPWQIPASTSVRAPRPRCGWFR